MNGMKTLLLIIFSLTTLSPSIRAEDDLTEKSSLLTQEKLLKDSQISYRAEGGFTGVRSYGVIISCVKGKISVMKTAYDPRLPEEQARIHQIGILSQEQYLALWDELQKRSVLTMRNAPLPKFDITDEFTVHFYAKAGVDENNFQAYGLSRPEISRYLAVRKMIDETVNMSALWSSHSALARTLDVPEVSRRNVSPSAPY